jgi:thymidylate kinase
MDINIKKPCLIIIEGPAGVGKTTMQKYLLDTFSIKNMSIDSLPEFSNNEIGLLIKENCQYENENPNWLSGINGLMLFLADKISVLETTYHEWEKIWICDRFITTQFVLGLNAISNEKDSLLAKETIQRVFEWSLEKISEQSIFIFLDSNLDILQSRLENRINRSLTKLELNNLELEINGYRKLANSIEAKNVFIIEANHSVNDVGNKISKLIYSVWKQ